jgi:fructokinase
MKRIIAIGECALDVIFNGSTPVGAMPGSRIVNASAILAGKGHQVSVVSEASRDSVGDIIVDFLNQAGVDTHSIDRFTEGVTPSIMYFKQDDGSESVTRYENYPDECFDVVWPRINPGDLLLFGGFYALDSRIRPRMLQLVNYAKERHATIVYLPGFLKSQAPRITRVMPAILENFELADIIITRSHDLTNIYDEKDVAKCFNNHISFYCNTLVNIDSDAATITVYNGSQAHSKALTGQTRSLTWCAGATAGIVETLLKDVEDNEQIYHPDAALVENLLNNSINSANDAVAAITQDWKLTH